MRKNYSKEEFYGQFLSWGFAKERNDFMVYKVKKANVMEKPKLRERSLKQNSNNCANMYMVKVCILFYFLW
jgi:hypothetical protein